MTTLLSSAASQRMFFLKKKQKLMLKIDIAASSGGQVMGTYSMCFPSSPLEARHITDDKLLQSLPTGPQTSVSLLVSVSV